MRIEIDEREAAARAEIGDTRPEVARLVRPGRRGAGAVPSSMRLGQALTCCALPGEPRAQPGSCSARPNTSSYRVLKCDFALAETNAVTRRCGHHDHRLRRRCLLVTPQHLPRLRGCHLGRFAAFKLARNGPDTRRAGGGGHRGFVPGLECTGGGSEMSAAFRRRARRDGAGALAKPTRLAAIGRDHAVHDRGYR